MLTRSVFVFITFVAILGGHVFLVLTNLYALWWWADVVMHIFGGLWVGLAMTTLFPRISFVQYVASLFIFGIGWEVLEFFFNTPLFGVNEANPADPIWILDTLTDLVNDVWSGLFFWYLRWAYNRSHA